MKKSINNKRKKMSTDEKVREESISPQEKGEIDGKNGVNKPHPWWTRQQIKQYQNGLLKGKQK